LLPAVSSLSTLRQLIPATRGAAPDPMLVFADPDFGGVKKDGDAGRANVATDDSESPAELQAMAKTLRLLPQLPGARMEGAALEAALGGQPGSLLIGADASKAALMARNADGRLARVRVLEFATHGLVARATDWLDEPALVLAAGPKPQDELLMASEASTLKLNADWVLLSACDTASPDAPEAEGLSGLTRAFFFAGARSLLISHWPVRDDVTARLIPETLLAERRTAGMSRAEALREASLAILDDPKLRAANPSAWAPFTLVGEADR
jgi:CHAT domain-containing protein